MTWLWTLCSVSASRCVSAYPQWLLQCLQGAAAQNRQNSSTCMHEQGEPRPPFDSILADLKPHVNPPPIISVDIPSGAVPTFSA